MINKYPLWKYLLILATLTAGFLYSVPNLFGEDPALQISAGARTVKVDAATRDRVGQSLEQAGLKTTGLELTEDRLLVRFTDPEDQIKGQAVLKETLGRAYVVALNLAPRTPDWLLAINAYPMYLGLDLRGGVHFLMEVDVDAAIKQAEERYVSDFRLLLRDERVRYLDLTRRDATEQVPGAVVVKLSAAEDLAQAEKVLEREYPNLEFKTGAEGSDFYLEASINENERRDTRLLALKQNITTLRNRVDELGVAEPVIQQQGQDRIVVQLPGVQDTARAKEILGATATLEFRMVDEQRDVRDAVAGRVPPGSKLYRERNGDPVLLKNQVMLTGDYIIDASSGIDQQSGGAAVFITLDGKGASIFSKATGENVKKLMAVVFIENKTETRLVDGHEVKTTIKLEEVINIARIQEQLSKRFQITGLDSTEEARDLALLLRAGALAAPIEIIEERTVGPSLGAENIEKGFKATLIGFVVITLFMVAYYRVFGVIASFALFINMVFLVAILSILQATLTLPGIAGIALTLGMAIDANVLIYERVREELRNGSSPQAAIHAGYDRAWGTILDSNITTLIAGIALFLLGSGSVRGFAVVLCIGILTSMFSAVVVSRGIVNLLFGQRRIAKLPIGQG